jgi:hypothetical protein
MKAARPNKAKSKETRANARALLSQELAELIPSLDEEGLAFLVEQARVHLRNMEIDRLNAETEAMSHGAEEGTSAKTRRPADLRIERSSSGSSYHVISGGKWKMFTDEEMLSMVKIASSDDGIRDVVGRLYAWLDTERPDAFADLDIEGAHDPKMTELVDLLRAKFKVRKR